MSKRVASQEITELIVDLGIGHREKPQQTEPDRNGGNRNRENRQQLSFCQAGSKLFDRAERPICKSRPKAGKKKAGQKNQIAKDFSSGKENVQEQVHGSR